MQRTECRAIFIAVFTIMTVHLLLASRAAASSYKTIHEFTWAKNPEGNLVRDAAGNLYGTTYQGPGSGCGGLGCGAVWKLAPDPSGTWTVSILHVFKGADGGNPYAGLVLDAAGNLYGTTAGGGASNEGTVFKLHPNSDGTWTERVLHNFSCGSDGCSPQGELIFDAIGNLYGTTARGAYGGGIVFKLAPNPDGSWTESILHMFGSQSRVDGLVPSARLVFDSAGNLYGTTSQGGDPCNNPAAGCGVVFKVAPNPDGTWTETVLYRFSGGSDGASPWGAVIFDAAGNLYGTTVSGGTNNSCALWEWKGCGVVFKLAPSPDGIWTELVLHSFTGGADGCSPQAGLIFDSAGNLYGTTAWGGDVTRCSGPNGGVFGGGVVFKLAPTLSGWSETVLHTFVGCGSNPQAPLLLDPEGHLYGTTLLGFRNYGLVFEITP
jgi:uncharacterized repeat protein (TIGR03803 family)